MSADLARALGINTGSAQLDAYLAVAIPGIVRRGYPVFAGEDADQRLDRAREHVDQLLQLIKQRTVDQLDRTVACGDRCPACCVYCEKIEILPLELRRIMDLVERQGRLEEVERRAKARQARGKGACPFLSRNGRCTVYDERPLSCRRYHSLDREACRRCAHDGGKTTVPWISEMVAAGLALMVLAQLEPAKPIDLVATLPGACAARLKQAKKRQRRAARASR